MLAWYIGLRYLRRRRAAWLALAAITLTVAASVVVMGISQGFVDVMERQVRAMESDLTAEPSPGRYAVDDTSERRRQIAEVPGVVAVGPFIQTWALMTPRSGVGDKLADSRYTVMAQVDAVDWAADTRLGRVDPRMLHAANEMDLNAPPMLPERRGTGFLTPDWRDHTVLIGLSVIAGAGALPPPPRSSPIPGVVVGREIPYSQGITVGTQVRLETTTGKVRAEVSDTLASGVYEIDRMAVFMPLPLGQRLADMHATDERPAQVGGYRARLADGVDARAAAAAVEERSYLWVRTWRQRRGNLVASAEQQRDLMLVQMIVIQFITVFIVYAVFSTLVAEKRHDLGVLLGIGARPRQVMGVFLVASLVACGIGSALGWALGWAVLPVLDPLWWWLFDKPLFPPEIFYSSELPISFDPQWPLLFLGLMSGVGLLAALLPAWRASRIDPAAILREAD
ncbi:MAG TPA: FtsX-like permease family protein [Planctomycetota bacterium]|nr:FtsX-like permease family protein [Planctomycetota bacterium]